MQRITGLPDEQVAAYEAQIEAAVRLTLQQVMDTIARRIEASMPVLASALVGADGDVPPNDGLPPGQPYVSPDDLAAIPPAWQAAVEQQILPIVAQVFMDAVGQVHAGMVDASGIAALPSVGSLASEQYLAQAQATFDQIGDGLWETARADLLEGFEQGESIPQLADRLRASAGVSARTGVLVARTQVIEASNAGSFAVAQASGLQMKKEFIATPDLRTRPTHLAADGQRVDLNEPFIVGGYSAMFPAAPSLPPAERYNCRCTMGYVMLDAAVTKMRENLALQQAQEELPGTEGPLTQIFPKLAGPGIDLPARGAGVPPSYVRPPLAGAKTPRQLRRVWQDEVEAITGHGFFVDAMPRGISMATAREYAEGTLQMFEQFPAARMDRIHWFDDVAGPYAQVRTGGHALEFNMRYASEGSRSKLLASRRKDVAGWDTGTTSWSVRNDVAPQGVVYHEFTHILDEENLARAIHPQIKPLLIRHAQAEGVTDIEDLIKRRISSYATENYHEMIAEAGTDVMVNGAAASQLSRDIMDLVRAEYRRKGFAIRTAPVDELAAEAERAGQVFPKAAAPRQSLEELARLAPTSRRALPGGETAKVEEVTYPGGQRAVEKDYARPGALDQKTARIAAEGFVNAEALAADVLRVVGAARADVVRLSDHSILMEFVEGQQGGETGILKAPAAIVRSAEGRRLGLADALMGHRDRGGGNWMRTPDGGIVAIDNGGAFGFGGTAAGGNPFTSFIMGPTRESPWKARIELPSDIDLAEIRRGLLALKPRFEELGSRRQFGEMMSRLDEIEKRAVRVPPAPSLVHEISVTRPAAPAARSVSSMTVADLRAELKTADVAVPTGARKADLVRLVEERRATPTGLVPPAPPPIVAPATARLATMKVGELRDLARARGIPDAAKLRKADLIKALEAPPAEAVTVPAAVRKVAAGRDLTAEFASGRRLADVSRPERMGTILREQGFDGAPDVADVRGVNQVIDAGGVELFRGSSAERAQHLIGGSLHDAADSMGGGAFGTGIYTGGRGVAERYAGEDGLMRMALRPEARVIAMEDLRTIHGRLAPTWTIEQQAAFLDEGAFAAALGYDAVAYGSGPLAARNFIILNRTALIVERSPVLKTSQIRALSPKALRQYAGERGVIIPPGARKADIVAALTEPRTVRDLAAPVDAKALVRAAARERNKLIESSQATARLLAEVDELVAKGAGKAAIAQRLDPALLEAEQAFAGADPAVAKALRDALDTGDAAKLRSAITRGGTRAKVKPISKAGAKTTFDPDAMEAIGGVDIPKGAKVVVVRRGSTLTLPDGEVMTLTRPQVTLAAAPKPIEVVGRVVPGPGYERRITDLEDLKGKAPTKPPRQLGGGSTSDVSLITHGDQQVVEKVYGRRVPGSKAAIAKEVDAEELAPLVVESFGVRSAATIKTGADRVLMEFVDGETIAEKSVGLDFVEFDKIARTSIDSDEGRLMGLADYVMGNTDRNEGNWLITVVDGKRQLVAIDHGYAFEGLKGLDPPAGFLGEFLQDPAAGYALRAQVDVNPADLAVVRQRLEALRQRFVDAGRKTWHDGMMRRLKALEQRADPAAPVRLAIETA